MLNKYINALVASSLCSEVYWREATGVVVIVHVRARSNECFGHPPEIELGGMM